MKLSFWIPAFAVAFLTAGPAWAQAGGSESKNEALVPNPNLFGHDLVVEGYSGSALDLSTDTEAGGYSWPNLSLRTELHGPNSYSLDIPSQSRLGLGQPTYDPTNENIVLDTVVEWQNETGLTPYVGGSLGWVDDGGERTVPLFDGRQALSQNDNDNFAWGGILGVDWAFAQSWSTSLTYRYLNLGEVSEGAASDGDESGAEEFVSHDILLSLKYRF